MVMVEITWLFKNLRKLQTDTRTVNNSSGLRASSDSSSGLSSWADLLISARLKSHPKKRTFGIHAILPLRLYFHSLGMDRELQALVIVRSDGQDVRHGPQPLNDRSELQ